MQKFKFPMEYLRVTQGENDGYSHAGSLAMDFGGKDTGADKLYCPCDMLVKRCRHNANGELYLESTQPVEFADGTTDYARLLCIHDNKFNVAEGQVLKQGDYFYDEGGMGGGKANAFGTHVHIEAGKGKWKRTTQSANSQGTYVIENQSRLYDLFILGNDVEILDDGGYSWKRMSDFIEDSTEHTKIYGVDVSHNRSTNIMAKIKACGKADFAVLRVAIGSSSVDKNLKQYIIDSGNMKIGFFSANYFNSNDDAVAEADFLIDTIQSYGFTPDKVDLPIFCDWEYFSADYNKGIGINIAPEQLQEMTVAYCNRIIERGYKAGVYLNLDFWNNWYGTDFFEKHPEFYIWYARPDVKQPDRDCYLWQYSCGSGVEYGANEDLDQNILLGEYISNLSEIPTSCPHCEELLETIDALEKENAELKIMAENSDILNEKCNLLSEEIEAKNAEITRLSGIVTGLEVQVKFFCKELEKKEAETNIKHADNKESLLSLLFKLILKLFKGEK